VFARKLFASYLDPPRIHFTGEFRGDGNSRNNFACNFDLSNPLGKVMEWNYQGTNEWEFINTVVTAVVDENGREIPDHPLLKAEVFTNENHPFGKLVDLDVDMQYSSLYGLEFGLKHKGKILFSGKWSVSVIVQNFWVKMKCTSKIKGDPTYGTQSTTRITDISWSEQEMIREFHHVATESFGATGDLSVSISLDMCGVDFPVIGRVRGTIGVARINESLNVGGERKLEVYDMSFTYPCFNPTDSPWINRVPFKIDSERKVLVADFGNAFSILKDGIVIDIGALYFGIFQNGEVISFGEAIPYNDLGSSLWRQSGIIEVTLEDYIIAHLQISPLTIFVDSTNSSNLDNTNKILYPVKSVFPSFQNFEMVSLLLLEDDYFIRPMGYYHDRLEYSGSSAYARDTSDFILLVTQFGQPVAYEEVEIKAFAYNTTLPCGAVSPTEFNKMTDSNGQVSFTFKVNHSIPEKRMYTEDVCTDPQDYECLCFHNKTTSQKFDFVNKRKYHESAQCGEAKYSLPIDGQVYNFLYCMKENCTKLSRQDEGMISILAFSTMTYRKPYEWVRDVEPIFKQFHHLHYIMGTILNMSNFTEVTLQHNVKLLKNVFSKQINDPNYMPVTRDLSPTKKQMILEWLENPIYNSSLPKQPSSVISKCNHSDVLFSNLITNNSHFIPPRCKKKHIAFVSEPIEHDKHFEKIFEEPQESRLMELAHQPPRALFGFGSRHYNKKLHNILLSYNYNSTSSCKIEGLKKQLQKAVLLEFYTIPVYLTALYSIADNCNIDAYQAIKEIAMQEMLHFVQAANILIALGGHVKIDDREHVPVYPTTGLPGNVLPKLPVSLKKFDLQHVYYTMLAIEMPMLTLLPEPHFQLNTIGQFYNEIGLCIDFLSPEIFNETTVKYQVKWPWKEPDNLGKVYPIKDKESALKAIRQITEQGEGKNPINPEQIGTGEYGHFYRFEEIVCQKRLVQKDDDGYAYDGDPIKYDPFGVYPMRDNPDSKTVVPDSDCYVEAKIFHHIYRRFLTTLQEAFNKQPEKIMSAVELMEALQMHAKKCMWTPYGTGNTCGPVWNYDWD